MITLLLSLLLIAESAETSVDESHDVSRVPECGVASAFCILRIFQKPVTLSQVITSFQQGSPDTDISEVSLAEVRKVIEGFHLNAVSVEYDSKDIRDVRCPAILYLPPSRDNKNRVGHFVVLHSIRGDRALIVDLSLRLNASDRFVPIRSVNQLWSGKALLVAEQGISVTQEGLAISPWTSTVVLGIALTLFFWRHCVQVRDGKVGPAP